MQFLESRSFYFDADFAEVNSECISWHQASSDYRLVPNRRHSITIAFDDSNSLWYWLWSISNYFQCLGVHSKWIYLMLNDWKTFYLLWKINIYLLWTCIFPVEITNSYPLRVCRKYLCSRIIFYWWKKYNYVNKYVSVLITNLSERVLEILQLCKLFVF